MEGLLVRENMKRYPTKTIAFCSHAKQSDLLFKTPDFTLKVPDHMHYWVGAFTKTSIIIKQRLANRESVDRASASLADQIGLATVKQARLT